MQVDMIARPHELGPLMKVYVYHWHIKGKTRLSKQFGSMTGSMSAPSLQASPCPFLKTLSVALTPKPGQNMK